MGKAQGWEPVKQFQHHPKVRQEADDSRQTQALRESNWAILATNLGKPEGQTRRPSGRVDVERANYKGILYTQPFDPRPRVRMSERRYQELRAQLGGRG